MHTIKLYSTCFDAKYSAVMFNDVSNKRSALTKMKTTILIYPKSSYISSRLYGVILQKTVVVIVASM